MLQVASNSSASFLAALTAATTGQLASAAGDRLAAASNQLVTAAGTHLAAAGDKIAAMVEHTSLNDNADDTAAAAASDQGRVLHPMPAAIGSMAPMSGSMVPVKGGVVKLASAGGTAAGGRAVAAAAAPAGAHSLHQAQPHVRAVTLHPLQPQH